jgi:hypothetical protein
MFSFLKKPYPYTAFSLKDVLTYFIIGCFVSFFLIVFQPFEISIWHPSYKLLKLLGFGFVSFICPIIFKVFTEVLFRKTKPEETWTVWKESIALVLLLLFIALGNLCYSNLIGIAHFGFGELLFVAGATFLLGLFPVVASVAIKYNRFLILNQKDAQLMEEEVMAFQKRDELQVPRQEMHTEPKAPELLVLVSENEKDKIGLNPEDLLYIESADNYSTVYHIKQAVVVKQMMRGSLKRFESQIAFPFIIRCHRSYIVNLKQVNHIKGNAQGYKIEFKTELSEQIPVSRSYSKILFERLEELK